MTVQDLIDKLQGYPRTMRVVVPLDDELEEVAEVAVSRMFVVPNGDGDLQQVNVDAKGCFKVLCLEPVHEGEGERQDGLTLIK